MSGVELKLSKPIKAHGSDVEVLTLREPTTKDLIELGHPFLIVLGEGGDNSQRVEIQNGKVAKYIVRLAAIPASSVEQLSMNDFSAAQAMVLGFFGTNADGQVES